MANKHPQILHAATLAKTRLFEVEQIHLRYGNGEERHYERLMNRNLGAVLVVAVNANQELILVREYGAGVEEYHLGFAKGKIDPGETPAMAALRECQEEIGFIPQSIRPLKSITTSPGYMNHGIYVFLAEDLQPSVLLGDEPEPLEIVTWPLQDWRGLLREREFNEGRSIAALMLALDAMDAF